MKYKLIHAISSDQLSNRLQVYLNEGWKLYGDPFMQEHEHTNQEFFQAVIRDD